MRVVASGFGRRQFLAALSTAAISCRPPLPALADEMDPFNGRDRSKSPILLQQDYYYIFGQVPPRKISAPKIDQPQWNAFGSCVDNSCTYVPLQQRYNAYAKYEQRISRGLDSYRSLRGAIERRDWEAIKVATARGGEKGAAPAPAVDCLLKAGLLASQMLVSPNNLREKKECALATFYVNEASFALNKIAEAAVAQDATAASAAWEFGKDSWNSFLAVLNPSIVPKVGDQFELID